MRPATLLVLARVLVVAVLALWLLAMAAVIAVMRAGQGAP